MKAKTKYGVKIVLAALVISALAIWFTTGSFTQTFEAGTALGLELGHTLLRWLGFGILFMIVRWTLVTLIADGVEKGIAQSKSAEIEKTEKAKAATP